MVRAYVYSPFTGWISGLDSYCTHSTPNYALQTDCLTSPCGGNGGSHPITQNNFRIPSDISSGASGTSIKLWVNTDVVKSFKILNKTNNVCSPTASNPWNDGRIVELYGKVDGTCLIGKVFYGHLASPATASTTQLYLTSTNNGKQIGTVPVQCGVSGCAPCYPFNKFHVHMEAANGLATAVRQSLCCCNSVNNASTPIYYWDVTCPA